MFRFLFNSTLRAAMLSLVVLASSLAGPALAAPVAPAHPVAGTNTMLHNQFRAKDASTAVSSAHAAIWDCNQNAFDAARKNLDGLIQGAKREAGSYFSERIAGFGAATDKEDQEALENLKSELGLLWHVAQPCYPPAGGPAVHVAPFGLFVGDVSSRWFSGENNPAGTHNDVVNGIGEIDEGTTLAGIKAVVAIPNPGQPQPNGCCSDLEQAVNTLLEIGGRFAQGDSTNHLNGIMSDRDRLGFPFPDPNNTGISLGDPNASVYMMNKRELQLSEAMASFWWRLWTTPNLAQTLFGIGAAVSNLDTEESVRYMVDAPAFAPGRFSGTYRNDADTNCARFWGGAQTHLGVFANTRLRARGEAGVNTCQTDLDNVAAFNDALGAATSSASTSFSDSETAFYARGELALDVNLQNIFGVPAKATIYGAVSTGDLLIPTLDISAGSGSIDWQNPVNLEVGVRTTIVFGNVSPPDTYISDPPLPIPAMDIADDSVTPFQIDVYVSVTPSPTDGFAFVYYGPRDTVTVPLTSFGTDGMAAFDPKIPGASGIKKKIDTAFEKANVKFNDASVIFEIRNIFFIRSDQKDIKPFHDAENDDFDPKFGEDVTLASGFANATKDNKDAFRMLVAPVSSDSKHQGVSTTGGFVSVVPLAGVIQPLDNGFVVIHELTHCLGVKDHGGDGWTRAMAATMPDRGPLTGPKKADPKLVSSELNIIKGRVSAGKYDAALTSEEKEKRKKAKDGDI